MYCPKCKIEFREASNTCPDCGSALEELPQDLSPSFGGADNEPVLLTLAENQLDSLAICGLLEQEGIPNLKKYRGADSYLAIYTGRNNQSIEIYVPKSSFEKSLSLIEVLTCSDDEISLDNEDLIAEEKWNKKGRYGMRVFLFLVWGIPIILVLIGLLVSISLKK